MSGSTRVSRYQKGKTKKVYTNLDLLEQEIVSGSGICWAICKSAPHADNHANIPPLKLEKPAPQMSKDHFWDTQPKFRVILENRPILRKLGADVFYWYSFKLHFNIRNFTACGCCENMVTLMHQLIILCKVHVSRTLRSCMPKPVL